MPTKYGFFVTLHCVKSVHIGRFSGPHFPAIGLNTEIYSVNLCIQSEAEKCGPEKLRIETLFTQCIFYAVTHKMKLSPDISLANMNEF